MCGDVLKIDLVYPEQIATSSLFSPLLYLIYTGVVAVVFVAFQLLHFQDNLVGNGIWYFAFLTNVALVLETVTMVLLHLCTAVAYCALKAGSSQEAPCFVRMVVALWYMIQPNSLIVVILYWTLINPIWDPRPISLSSAWAHLLNWLVLLTSLFFSAIPWSFKNAIWGLFFLLAYLAWTLIHFFFRIGTKEPCDNYPQPECPLYPEFDWNQPGFTSLVVLAALVAYFVVAGLYTGLFRCRDSCAASSGGTNGTTESERGYAALVKAEQAENAERPVDFSKLPCC